MSWPIPHLVAWGLFAVAWAVAIVWTFHDTRVKSQKQEREYVRQSRIEGRKPYLTEIPNILRNMQMHLGSLVQNQVSKPIEVEKLYEVDDYIYQEKGFSNDFNARKQIEWLFEFSCAMNALELGLARMKSASLEWRKLEDQLKDYLAHNPDAQLNDNINNYLVTLDGAYSYILSRLYVEKYRQDQNLRDKTKSIGARQTMETIINRIYVKVTKRLEELLNGDEAK